MSERMQRIVAGALRADVVDGAPRLLTTRQAAERLVTPVTRQHAAPFTTNPVADARLIIAHLSSNASDNAPR